MILSHLTNSTGDDTIILIVIILCCALGGAGVMTFLVDCLEGNLDGGSIVRLILSILTVILGAALGYAYFIA